LENLQDSNTLKKGGKNMKKFTVLVCSLFLLSISGLATAGQESGLYIGGSLGQAWLDISENDVDFDDDDWGYKIFAGYNFGLIPLLDLAVEGSYVDFGEASSREIGNQDVDITGWDVFGLACFNLGPIGVFGKVGQIWWDSDSDAIQDFLDDSGNDMAYGIGVRFQIGSIALRAEYELFDLDIADVDYVSVGAAWTF
jgi:opacity protein-like surface antigen